MHHRNRMGFALLLLAISLGVTRLAINLTDMSDITMFAYYLIIGVGYIIAVYTFKEDE